MEPKAGPNFQVVDKRRSHDAEGAARRPISPDQRAHSVCFPDFADPVLGIMAPFRAVQRVIRIRPDEYFVYG